MVNCNTVDSRFPDSQSLLEQVLPYRELGWSIIQIPPRCKAARIKWKQYQSRIVDDFTIRRWFSRPCNVALVTGGISGVAVRDFDDMAAYTAWSSEHPRLASICPTVETPRGRHVYFRAAGPVSTKSLVGGELRADGGYVMLPPSTHPNGSDYRWLIPVTEVDSIPVLEDGDLAFDGPDTPSLPDSPDSGLTEEEQKKNRSIQKTTEAIKEEGKESGLQKSELEAIRASLPTAAGQRERRLFQLARRLLSIRDDLSDTDWLVSIFDQWWDSAQYVVATPEYEVSLLAFMRSCKAARFPLANPLTAAEEQARAHVAPVWAHRFSPAAQLLASICRELQRMQGENPFFLSARSAGKLSGVSHVKAAEYLKLFVMLGRLQLVEPGKRGGGYASRYRYVSKE